MIARPRPLYVRRMLGIAMALIGGLVASGLSFGGVTEDIPFTVTLLIQKRQGQPVGSGTGFFFVNQVGQAFLVTNRHMMYEDQNRYGTTRPIDILECPLHKKGGGLGERETMTLTARDAAGVPRWIAATDPIDIAAIPIDANVVRQRANIIAFDRTSLLPGDYRLGFGDQLLVVGYPLGYHDAANNLPILRTGTVASVPSVPYGGLPLFLLDGQIHPGMNGSPVLVKPSSVMTDTGGLQLFSKPVTYLVGIHSGSVALKSKDGTQIPLGLHSVWYGKIIADFLDAYNPAPPPPAVPSVAAPSPSPTPPKQKGGRRIGRNKSGC